MWSQSGSKIGFFLPPAQASKLKVSLESGTDWGKLEVQADDLGEPISPAGRAGSSQIRLRDILEKLQLEICYFANHQKSINVLCISYLQFSAKLLIRLSVKMRERWKVLTCLPAFSLLHAGDQSLLAEFMGWLNWRMMEHRTGKTETCDKVLDFSERGSIAWQLCIGAANREV